ncbi:cupin domain-containing protein [Secundilactobacillus silagei]|uniref:LytTR family transcriptional regulator n=1 Tax=Secundilactobacillus silagei JCM 19001 TaxID=1302250 RepID=A0A1Z5IK97_9LACO|nr:cupin domain-containing protein [Secundilactobacillus silagei]TDG71239.1 hypothetical protein C5L25_001155 [Secundilactobacillus silagei JCM 19001]GAX02002.1 LytTR family transcriptional regulator [Secundilactobacillus silagei JCM 19001]
MNNKTEVTHGLFDIGNLNTAFVNNFVGDSYHNSLVKETNIPVTVSNVFFEPGARNNWDIHHNGYQILLVTGGEGWYQEDDHSAQKLHSGDVVITHEGVKHWHGATQNNWFSHVAITAGTPIWLEPVNNEDYQQLN